MADCGAQRKRRTGVRGRMVKALVPVLLLAAGLALTGGVSTASAAAVKPSVSLDNDANHDGVFSDTENVAKSASYPWTVTYRLTINAGTLGHTVAAISDTAGSLTSATSSPNCASLVGTHIAAGGSATCYYDVAFALAATAPVVNTVTFTYDGGGGDVVSDTSTVNFPSLSLVKSSTTTLVTAAGQLVPYSYLVGNTGTVAVTGIAVSDNNVDAAPVCPQSTLNPGATMVCSAQHTVTVGELAAGEQALP